MKLGTYLQHITYNIALKDNQKNNSDIIFLLLNSMIFRFLIDLFSRQLTGNQTLSDVDVSVASKTLIPDPDLFKNHKKAFAKILKSIKGREQGTIYEECMRQDKIDLENIIFEVLGLDEKDREELFLMACKYVKDRQEKSNSLTTSKTKTKLSEEASLDLIKRRFSEIKQYADLLLGKETKKFTIPEGNAKIPKDLLAEDVQIFQDFSIFFEGNKKMTFAHKEQFNLFYFFYDKLKVRDTAIVLPTDKQVCIDVRAVLKFDFDKNFEQIQAVLKTSRSKTNAFEIYKKIIFGGK